MPQLRPLWRYHYGFLISYIHADKCYQSDYTSTHNYKKYNLYTNIIQLYHKITNLVNRPSTKESIIHVSWGGGTLTNRPSTKESITHVSWGGGTLTNRPSIKESITRVLFGGKGKGHLQTGQALRDTSYMYLGGTLTYEPNTKDPSFMCLGVGGVDLQTGLALRDTSWNLWGYTYTQIKQRSVSQLLTLLLLKLENTFNVIQIKIDTYKTHIDNIHKTHLINIITYI